MKKFLLVFSSVAMSLMLFTGCGGTSANQENQKLTVGTNPEFPPFEYINETGNIDGFDFALMNEIGSRINKDIVFKSMEFKSLVGALETGSIDAIIAGMTVTEERLLSVDFSDEYYQATQCIIVSQDNTEITQLSDLSEKTVAVQEGTTGDFIASGDDDLVIDAKVKRFKKGADAIMDLKSGSSDAVLIDSNPAKEFVAANPDDLKFVEDKTSEESYAIAVKKGDTELLDEINAALKEIKTDGTFDALIDEYISE